MLKLSRTHSVALGCVVGGLALATPAGALASDTFVDQGTGQDSGNSCHNQANPCRTVVRGIAQAGTGDTVFVEGGHTYTAALSLGDGKSLVHKDFVSGAPGGKAVLNSGTSSNPDITVVSDAGQIKGFTIRSQQLPMDLNGKAKVVRDTFDTSNPIVSRQEILINLGAGNSKIEKSTFVDPTPTEDLHGVGIEFGTTGSPEITGNTFKGFYVALDVAGTAKSQVTNNTITGTHEFNGTDGVGMNLNSDKPVTIVGNVLKKPAPGTNDVGFNINGASAEIDRNTVDGFIDGASVNIPSPGGSTSFDSDEFVDIAGGGSGVSIINPSDSATLTNVTIWGGNPAEAIFTEGPVTINSSIVDSSGISVSGGSCAITFSRGPTTTPGGNGCADFQTTSSPAFVAPGNGDFHLKSTSAMIDAGDPANPPAGAKDIDGDPRALDGPDGGNCNGTPRRDIGADEFKC